MACVIIDTFSHLKVFVVFVDCVVCQVHQEVAQLFAVRVLIEWLVFLGGKAHYSILVHEYFERLTAQDKDIEPKVKLEIVDEIRILEILLDNMDFLIRDLIKAVSHEYTFTLTHTVWFNDHGEL